MAKRLKGMGLPQYQDVVDKDGWTGKIILAESQLEKPLHWREPRMVFVCSMGDLFHEDAPEEYIKQVFDVMGKSAPHTFQILTRRPARMLNILTKSAWWNNDTPRNIWLGVSVENQEAADERIPILLQIPAAVRFVSAEPMLGQMNLRQYLADQPPYSIFEGLPALDWVIAGGESGPGARPMRPYWVRNLRDQCQEAEVPLFMKEWGAWSECAQSQETGLKYQLGDSYETVLFMDDGRTVGYDHAHSRVCDLGYLAMSRVGKKRAGRLLDLDEHRRQVCKTAYKTGDLNQWIDEHAKTLISSVNRAAEEHGQDFAVTSVAARWSDALRARGLDGRVELAGGIRTDGGIK